MKAFLPLFFALTLPLLGQEVFENSNFSDGSTHWHGDCKPAGADATTDFTSDAAANAAGISVDLHSLGWTRVTQEIHEHNSQRPSSLMLTIVYQASPDFKLSTKDSDYQNIGPSIGFGGARLSARTGQLTALIDIQPYSRSSVSSSGGYNNYTIYLDRIMSASFVPTTDGKAQTFSVPFNYPPTDSKYQPTFCIALPPGSGSITFLKISLAPAPSQGNP